MISLPCLSALPAVQERLEAEEDTDRLELLAAAIEANLPEEHDEDVEDGDTDDETEDDE